MLTNGKYWAGIVTGVLLVWGYHRYAASKLQKG